MSAANMATNHRQHQPHATVTDTTPIVIKISFDSGAVKKVRLPLKDLRAEVLPDKLRSVLPRQSNHVYFERFSDSLGGYVSLDPTNREVFKSLQRAAKAKLKLKLRVREVSPAVVKAVDVQFAQTMGEAHSDNDKANKTGTKMATAPTQQTTAVSKGDTSTQNRQGETSNNLPHKANGTHADAAMTSLIDMSIRSKPSSNAPSAVITNNVANAAAVWLIYCNECDNALADTHYHCSICQSGDYDLCEACVDKGKTCRDEHWLIKRTIKDGMIVSSTTERHASRQPQVSSSAEAVIKGGNVKTELDFTMPGAFKDDKVSSPLDEDDGSRTCNSCLNVDDENMFVNCKDCDDFDLCFSCHIAGTHGHHPAHSFQTATAATKLSVSATALLPAGRDVKHDAVCDGCDKMIRGVRHKCLDCPDFDYCSECHKKANLNHRRHRFMPLYEPIDCNSHAAAIHTGVMCDGVACSSQQNQGYIRGIRYKCVVCKDIDFCASCEALPDSAHNKTHPMVKMYTPIRNIDISTVHEDEKGAKVVLSNHRKTSAAGAVSTTSPVKTIAEINPKFVLQDQEASSTKPNALEAVFVKDSPADGTAYRQGESVVQTWTLRNSGSSAWPLGCKMAFVGGDEMANTKSAHCHMMVSPGSEGTFTAYFDAPQRVGKAISYWRLQTHDGRVFGPRLWCDMTILERLPQGTWKTHDYVQTYLERMQETRNATLKSRMNSAKEERSCIARLPIAVDRSVAPPSPALLTPTSASATETDMAAHEASQPINMVFPKLERESPAHSTAGLDSKSVAALITGDKPVQSSDAAPTNEAVKLDVEDGFEDVSYEIEVLSADDSDSDAGFLTDEEYDVLDGSDQETVSALS